VAVPFIFIEILTHKICTSSGMKFVDRIFLAAEFPAVRMDKDPKRPRL